LNSRAVNFWFSSTFPEGLHIKINQLHEIPFPETTDNQRTELSKLVIKIQEKYIEFQNTIDKFSSYLKINFREDIFNSKLYHWHELEFGDFMAELQKASKFSGKKISKLEEMEWMEVFEFKKQKAQTLKAEIAKTDREIDRMVYELYGLTEEEIGIVEGSINLNN
jgi:hypothetical protein